ncbi:class IIb bacteriocin, lactobin A/cerein 7B family [Helcococcus ovis]|uniref:class IIb bacteriocin, lactobin A/cerein 7B family n=1 Tax=Helcococcus ovis TaxID=72026 RepID=UPI0038B87071
MENNKFVELKENGLLDVDGGIGVGVVIGFIVVGSFILGGVRGCAAKDSEKGYK